MTLILNAPENYTYAGFLAADLKSAIKAGYRTLQISLKTVRSANYYEGKLNIKGFALLAAGRKVLTKLEEAAAVELQKKAVLKALADTSEDQILFHRIMLKTAPVSETARQWVNSLDLVHEQGVIIMIHQPSANGDSYVTYASHAQALANATDRQAVTENRVSEVSIPHSLMWHYQSRMRATYGIEIQLVG